MNKMKNQFFYTRLEQVQSKDPLSSGMETKEYRCSFNINKVIRSMQIAPNACIVVLDDFHEELREIPSINPKNNKVQGMKKERAIYQSEITLDGEDYEKFMKLTSIEE